MTFKLDRANRLRDMMNTPGWRDVVTMLNEEAKGAESELCDIMASRPEQLTSQSALKYAIRSRALRDFLESLTDEVKLLEVQR